MAYRALPLGQVGGQERASSHAGYCGKARTAWLLSVLQQPGVKEVRGYHNPHQTIQQVMIHVEFETLDAAVAGAAEVQASSRRLKFGGLFSTFVETTNIRINGVYPAQEFATCPQLVTRMTQGPQDSTVLERGKMLVPTLHRLLTLQPEGEVGR